MLLKKIKTEMDTSQNPGYETTATVYNVNTGPIGFRFTLMENEGISGSELKTMEEEVLKIINTIEVQ